MEKKDLKNKEKTVNKESFKEIVPYIIIIICVILFRTFLFTPIRVNGTSMVNTLHDGDTMILNKISLKTKEIKRFQIIVIRTDDSYLIKRVIGLPGEKIKYSDGKLYINGKRIEDPYYKNNTDDFDVISIPKDNYFVMGDNRSNSIDSRIIGVIPKTDIKGTTKLIIFPFKNVGNVN